MIDIQKRFSDRDDVQSIVDELTKEWVINIQNQWLTIRE
jgi:hypothetical protein